MGLEAGVSCRCWQDGVSTAPPVPVEFVDGELSIVGDESAWSDAQWDAFYEWQRVGCAHEHTLAALERIGSNWSGTRRFTHLVADAGRVRFATIVATLDGRLNFGTTPASVSARLVAELVDLRSPDVFVDVERTVGVGTITVTASEAVPWEIGCLERVARASVETGNPIVWS